MAAVAAARRARRVALENLPGVRPHPKITDMRGNAWVMVAVCAGLAACEIPQETADEIACTTLCRCAFTLPGDRDACVTECVDDLGPVSEPCAECISLHADTCPTLFDDCATQCSSPQPSEGGP